MIFAIEHESLHSLRIRVSSGKISGAEEQVLVYALSHMKGVKDVQIFRATGGIRLTYEGERDYILEKLRSFSYKNVELLAETVGETISTEELTKRKLSPELKRRLRTRLLLETAADIIMPMPLQVGYHVYQMVTLRNL